jgi:iron complex outermembrane receptor protein
VTAGARGVRSEWFWDLSAQYGYNSFDFNVRDSLNVSLGPSIPPNQTEFYSGSLLFNQFLGNVDVSRQVDIGLDKPINAALGFEYRRENYEIIAGEPNSYLDAGHPNQFGGRAVPGAQVFPGFRPSNEIDTSRHSVAAYVDLEGDLIEQVRLGLAGRLERYSDFGSTGDGKLTVRFQPDRFVIGAVGATRSANSPQSANFLPVGEPSAPPVGSPQARARCQDRAGSPSTTAAGCRAERVGSADVYRVR